jgi:SOS response regulatory protein OraA/RecX
VTTVLGIRISEELKRELEENGYDSETIRTLLEEDLKRKKREKAIERLKQRNAAQPKLGDDYASKFIRESRDTR